MESKTVRGRNTLKVQTHVSSEDGKFFGISFNSDYVSFSIIELEPSEIDEMINDIKAEVYLLKEAYKESEEKTQK